MIHIRDIKNNISFIKEYKESEQFIETYEDPSNLVIGEVIYADGSGFNKTISCIMI